MTLPSDLLPGAKTVPFACALASHGDRTALITSGGEVSYHELAAQVAATARDLGPGRRLVLLAGANTIDAVVVYLAALSAGHPVLLVPGDSPGTVQSLIDAYNPDVVARPAGGRWLLDERRPVSAHDLHPDLALLLSTSGSTGSPKLVRLSHQNLQANAESIAQYLAIREDDRAATTLPMHYCYGLSVINSHLLSGAGLILTDLSVADSCFWDLFGDRRGSTFAGVPYTFDLLDRVGFAGMRLPHLRYVTQAGGRMTPDRVAHYATLGRRSGWDLLVMYGQTEATARMAYLPADLAAVRPQAIGVPVPGGSIRLQPLADRPEKDTGELVYRGPNVMLGYAESPADLSLGRTVDELYTGDIARRTPDGLYELVGRRSRFAKILGMRIDPQRIETMLETLGIASCCTGDDHELVVAVAGDADARHIRRLVAGECGLPARAVRVFLLAELPRLPTGKLDYRAVRELTRTTTAEGATVPAAGPVPVLSAPGTPTAVATGAGRTGTGTGTEPGSGSGSGSGSGMSPESARAGSAGPADLCRLYAEVLDRTDVSESSSFVSLGGDSLCYVEMSLRLEKALGRLPADWHTLPIRDLRPLPVRRSAIRRRSLETSVALRAVAIVLIAGSHIPVFFVQGGAHVLLGVAGFNFARFHLTSAERHERIRHAWSSIARIAVPSMVWITLAVLVTREYDLANAVLLNSVLGPYDGSTEMHYWFVEALVYFLVAVTIGLTLPALDRTERRFPFGFPVALMALGLVTRYDLVTFDVPVHHLAPVVVFWLFALGWATGKARTVPQRVLLTAAVLATIPGFFGQPQREAVVIAGLLLLVWVPSLPSPGPLSRIMGLLASSSLYIYLTHWQVFPHLKNYSPLLALIVSLGVGLAYATVATRLMRRLPPLLRRAGKADRRTRARAEAPGDVAVLPAGSAVPALPGRVAGRPTDGRCLDGGHGCTRDRGGHRVGGGPVQVRLGFDRRSGVGPGGPGG